MKKYKPTIKDAIIGLAIGMLIGIFVAKFFGY
jgi:hypothetical protein